MIEITSSIHIHDHEIQETFMRASGPGGQKVNKTESAVQLRFNAKQSAAINDTVFLRLKILAGRRMTKDGVIVLTANQFRTQELNRADAIKRLTEMIKDAATAPKYRRPTKPSRNAKAKRVDSKTKRGSVKKNRGRVSKFDD